MISRLICTNLVYDYSLLHPYIPAWCQLCYDYIILLLFAGENVGQCIRIEKWSENLDEATLGQWLKSEGEMVGEAEIICEIITDKITFEYEAPCAGILLKQYCPEKSTIPVGYVFAFIGDADEALPEGIEEANARLMQEHTLKALPELDFDLSPVKEAASGVKVRATPAARRVARENNITIEDVAAWSGNTGPVAEDDVRRYLETRTNG